MMLGETKPFVQDNANTKHASFSAYALFIKNPSGESFSGTDGFMFQSRDL